MFGHKVPLYPGSSVMASRLALTAALQSATATAMARALLLAVFDIPTLLKSNLKGGKSKRPDVQQRHTLERLDDHKMTEIFSELFNFYIHYIIVIVYSSNKYLDMDFTMCTARTATIYSIHR